MSEHTPLTEAEVEVASIHQFHGDDCLCGFSSARSRSRTEHILNAVAARTSTATAGEHNCARCSDAPGCFCGWAHWESCPAATADEDVVLPRPEPKSSRRVTATADTGLRERVEALHNKTHWCFDDEGGDCVFEPGTEWWPCPTMAALDATAAPTTDTGARE